MSPAVVVVLNERGHRLDAYPHPHLTGDVVLDAPYAVNALEITEEAGYGHSGTCGLALEGGACDWYSESHTSRAQVAEVHAAHVAEAHR